MYDPYADFTKHVLSNGLEVHTQYMDRPWVRMDVVVHAGAREDPKGLPGLAHFVEHLVCQNIPNLEREEVEDFFEAHGGWSMLGSTTHYSSHYRFKTTNSKRTFQEALAMYGSMLFEARIEKKVEVERKAILQEFNERYPFPEALEWGICSRKALFRGHLLETYGTPLGNPKGFLHAKERDLQGFYDTHYTPQNTSVVLLGGLQTEEFLEELEKCPFGIEKSGERNSIPKPFTQLALPENCSKTVKFSDYTSFKLEQAKYTASWAFSANVSLQALRVFNMSLDKILFQEIREKKGIAYSIEISYYNFQAVYEYEIKLKLKPESVSYINDLVQKCIQRVAKERSLFERSLASKKHEWYMGDTSGSNLVKDCGSDLAKYQRIVLIQEALDDLNQVTFEQMAEMVALLSPERQFTFITVP